MQTGTDAASSDLKGAATKPKKKPKRRFSEDWKRTRKWLIFFEDGEERGFKCQTCIDGGQTGKWATEPYEHIQEKELDPHVRSTMHKNALDAIAQHKRGGLFATHATDIDKALLDAWRQAFTAIYFLAKEEVRTLVVCDDDRCASVWLHFSDR